MEPSPRESAAENICTKTREITYMYRINLSGCFPGGEFVTTWF